MPQLKREFFVAHPLDGPLLSLSLGYAAVRRFQSGLSEAKMGGDWSSQGGKRPRRRRRRHQGR